MGWWQAAREVWRYEWLLLQRHPKLAAAAVGLLFVPALYALIYLWGMWDPGAHTRALPAGLVNLDTGASYRGRDLNLGAEALAAIEKHGQFAYQRYTDPAERGAACARANWPSCWKCRLTSAAVPCRVRRRGRPSSPSTPPRATTTAAPALRAALHPKWRSA